jgi:serine/threonine protein kinase
MLTTLSTSAFAKPPPPLSSGTQDLGEGLIGRQIDNHTLVRILGRGGMGIVYEARHPLLERRVAIKVLRPELVGNAAVATRFFNEARATFAIDHPGVVEVFDVGLLPEGVPYMAMELLQGETLGQRTAGGRTLDAATVIDIGVQAAEALAAAHARGIVHRDLKPDNLFLIADRGRDRVKVIDFGVAQVADPIRWAPIDTLPGSLLGTPAYMSPEQCRGIDGLVDHRTDVYALGIILYQLLCGAPPFVGAGWGDVLAMQMLNQPAPLARRRPDVPAALAAAIMKAIAKLPGQRFADMTAFAAALTVSLPPSRAAHRASAFVRIRRAPLLAAAAGVLALLAPAFQGPSVGSPYLINLPARPDEISTLLSASTITPSTPGSSSMISMPRLAPTAKIAVSSVSARKASSASKVTDRQPRAGKPVRASRMWW